MAPDHDPPPAYLRQGPLSLSNARERRLGKGGDPRDGVQWRRVIPAAIALVTLTAFAAAVWLAYEQGVRRGLQLSPPIIRAETGPVKIPPVDAGGLNVANQDKEVFDVLVAEEPEARVEQLLPPPDEPLPAPEPPAADLAAAPAIEPEPVAEPEPVVEPAIVLTPPPGVAARPAPEPAIVLTPPPGVEPRAVPPAADLAAAQPVDPEPVEVAALAEATPDMLASFRIQLGSFRNRDSVLTHWAAVLTSNRAVLEGLSPLVRTADLGDRGTWYRLQAGPLVSSIIAIALCDVLKTNNVDCLVISP